MASIAIDRTDGLSSATAIKGPVRVATTANIALTGLQTVDGVSLAAGDRVLVKNQDTASENGIYVVDTGPWRRAKDFSGNRDVRKGTQILVTSGTLYASSGWYVSTADPIVIGTTAIQFTQNILLNAAQLIALEAAAQASADSASNSAGDAAADLAAMRDIFLGSYASDGDAETAHPTRETGSRYFNTTEGRDRVWTGAVWTYAGNGDMVASANLSDVDDARLAAGNLNLIERDTVADLQADTILDYSAGAGKTEVATNQIVRAAGFRYQVAASEASDHHITTAGGVKLYEVGPFFTTVSRLARLPGSFTGQEARVSDGVRAGTFRWVSDNLSSEVSDDPSEGIYIAPSTDSTGASGSWVRVYSGRVRFEWWGADPSGNTSAATTIQAALETCVDLAITDIDASNAVFNLTGGTGITLTAADARIRVNRGRFISTDGAETNILLKFVLLKEVEFIGTSIDRNYLGSTNIEDYNTAIAIGCYGVDLFRAEDCNIRNVKGDGLYATRDGVSGQNTDKNMGDVFWIGNKLHNCKRNYMAITSYINAEVSGNVCTSSGETSGTPHVWARSAVIDFEPNGTVDEMGYAVVTDNILKVTGAKNPLRWAVGSGAIPANLYESVIATGNIIECSSTLTAITVTCQAKLKYLDVSGNTIRCTGTLVDATGSGGIFITNCSGLANVNDNRIDFVSQLTEFGIYFGTASTVAKATANGNTIISRQSGDFRGIRANVSSGAQIVVNNNVIVANASVLQAVFLAGQSGSKATTLTANGNSYEGFTATTRMQIANAVRAAAIGNAGGGTVAGTTNDNQIITSNI